MNASRFCQQNITSDMNRFGFIRNPFKPMLPCKMSLRCTEAPSTSVSSSQCAIIGMSNEAASCHRILHHLRVLNTDAIIRKANGACFFQSCKIRQLTSKLIFRNCRIRKHIYNALCSALSNMYLTVSGVSITGRVLGMQAIVVNPPLAAERVPVAIVSLYSKPGRANEHAYR